MNYGQNSLALLQRIAPQWYLKKLMLTLEDTEGLSFEEKQNLTFFEEPGDLEQIFNALQISINEGNDNEMEEITMMYRFAMEAYGVIPHEEFRSIPSVLSFQIKWGSSLLNYFVICAWG